MAFEFPQLRSSVSIVREKRVLVSSVDNDTFLSRLDLNFIKIFVPSNVV